MKRSDAHKRYRREELVSAGNPFVAGMMLKLGKEDELPSFPRTR